MSLQDKIKWDKKYQENQDILKRQELAKSVVKAASLAPNKKALDLGCGGGRHSIFLAKNGFSVDAVDISSVAIEYLKSMKNNLDITPILADLDNFEIFPNKYGLIVKINYLDKALIKRAKNALVKGGIIVVETYVEDKNNEKKGNKAFLLQKGELKKLFDDFEVIEYNEFWNEPYEKYKMKKASIIAKKP